MPFLTSAQAALKQFKHLVFAAGAVILWGLCAALPVSIASRVGSNLLKTIGPRTRKHKHIIKNLSCAQPGASAAQLERNARGVWQNFGAVLAEYPHLRKIYRDRVTLVVAKDTQTLLTNKQPFMLLTAHLANWEIIGPIMDTRTRQMTAVYGPQNNPFIEQILQWFRNRASACIWIKKQNALRSLNKQSLQGGSVGLLADVRVDSGMLLPFFGTPAPTTISPARLTLRLGYPMVPARVKRVGLARFEIEMLSPLKAGPPGSGKLAAVDLITQYHKILESWISERPGEWLCTKRRWPKSATGN